MRVYDVFGVLNTDYRRRRRDLYAARSRASKGENSPTAMMTSAEERVSLGMPRREEISVGKK